MMKNISEFNNNLQNDKTNISFDIASQLQRERAQSFGEFFGLDLNANRVQSVQINFNKLRQIAKELGMAESVLSKLSYNKEDMFGVVYLQPLKFVSKPDSVGLYYGGSIDFNMAETTIYSDHVDTLNNKLDLYSHKMNLLIYFVKQIDSWLRILDYSDCYYKLKFSDETIGDLYGYCEDDQYIFNQSAIDFKSELIRWFCSI